MEAENNSEEAQLPPAIAAQADDLQRSDLDAPVVGMEDADFHQLQSAFDATAEQNIASDAAAVRAYKLLSAICSFHFKPEDRFEPYGPLAVFETGRSLKPSDFASSVAALEKAYERTRLTQIRARIADTIWLVDKSRRAFALKAIENYFLTAERFTLQDGAEDDLSLDHIYRACELLRRALNLSDTLRCRGDWISRAASLTKVLRSRAVREEHSGDFGRTVELDLDFDLSDACLLGRECEDLVSALKGADFHSTHRLLELAARAYDQAKLKNERDRCLISAAEEYVKASEEFSGSAMMASHWLGKAIQELRRVGGTRERRRELQHRLIDIQAGIVDEMSSFTHSDDITSVVKSARAHVSGKSLCNALGRVAGISQSPELDKLKEDALDAIRRHPLSSLFGATHHDQDGKVIHRTEGGDFGSPTSDAVMNKIAQHEAIRRSLVVNGLVRPALFKVSAEHSLQEEHFQLLAELSPFAPSGREAIYARGFYRLFVGDTASALHILLPQLENSVRCVLKENGVDTVRFNADETQEDMTLSSLFKERKAEINNIFGRDLAHDLEQTFLYRGGPRLRHTTLHGLLSSHSLYGADAAYGCWLIYRVLCLPLMAQWHWVEQVFAQHFRAIKVHSEEPLELSSTHLA